MLPPGAAFDLFRGTAAGARDEVETFPADLDRQARAWGWAGWVCTTRVCFAQAEA